MIVVYQLSMCFCAGWQCARISDASVFFLKNVFFLKKTWPLVFFVCFLKNCFRQLH